MKLVAALVGVSPDTVSPGVRELEEGVEPDGRVRRAGAGRPPVEQADPGCWWRWWISSTPGDELRSFMRMTPSPTPSTVPSATASTATSERAGTIPSTPKPTPTSVPTTATSTPSRVGGRISPAAPHRSGREPLGSSGLCRPVLRSCIAAPSARTDRETVAGPRVAMPASVSRCVPAACTSASPSASDGDPYACR